MSNSSKIVIGVVVVIILALAGWWYMGSDTSKQAPNNPVATRTNNNQTDKAAAANIPVVGLSTSAKDTSDAALDSDLSSVAAQIKGLSADNASVDSSVTASAQ